MKFLKGILYFILIVLGAVLLAAIFAPGTKVVERTISINAPKAAVFNQISNFENWKNWDPWFKLDTVQKRTYTGKLGDKDYGYSWISQNDNVDQGSIKMISFEEKERLDYRLIFGEGGESDATNGYFKLEEIDGITSVKWGFVSKKGYPTKIINYFMERFIAPDFEKGLANLKAYTEANPGVPAEHKMVEIVSEHGINYAVVKAENLSFTEMDSFFKGAYPEIYGYLQTNGLVPKGPSRALYYTWDTLTKTTTLAAAVPISDVLAEETESLILPIGRVNISSNSISYLQKGSYTQAKNNHDALSAWILLNGKEIVAPTIEEYIKSFRDTPDTTALETKIIYTFK
jgi:effector-binding domain-containing protein